MGFLKALTLKALKDTQYYFIAQVGVKGLSLLVIPILGRVLSIEQFGYYDSFLLFSGLVSMFCGLGIDSGIIIKLVENKDSQEELSKLLRTTLLICLLSTVLFFTICFIVFFFKKNISTPFWLLDTIFLYALLSLINYNIFNFSRWLGDAKRAALNNLFSSIIGMSVGIFLLFQSQEKLAIYYMVGMIIGSLLTLLYNFYTYRVFIFTTSPIGFDNSIKDLIKLSIPFAITQVANYGFQTIDRLFLMRYFGLYEVGLFGLSYRLAQIPNFIMQVIIRGFQPIIFNNYETEEGRRLGLQIVHLLFISLIPITISILFFGNYLLTLFGGTKYIAALPILSFIIMSVLIGSVNLVSGIGFFIKRKSSYISVITISSLLLIVVLSFVLMPFFQFKAIAIATYLSTIISTILYLYISERLYTIGYNFNLILISILIVSLLLFKDYFYL